MKKIVYNIILLLLGFTLFNSCQKELAPFQFSSTLEQPTVLKSSADAKNYFSDEEFILWEQGDAINVVSDNGGENSFTGALVGGINTRLAQFAVQLPENVEVCHAVYPASASAIQYKVLGGFTDQLIYPAVMPYRTADQPVDRDFSFGKNSFPMVAFWNNTMSDTMAFHSVSGIVRIQLFSSIAAKTIKKIVFEETSGKQISGTFDIENLNTNVPYLQPETNIASEDKIITISGINQVIGGSKGTALKTFYLPLPAQSNGSGNNLTRYVLKMTVYTNDGMTFTKSFGVDIRRNAITMMEAVDIAAWTVDHGATNVHLVGNGTKLRPFQIYDINDLVEVRDSINSNGTVNGQEITADTYFEIVRSDINLTADKWTSGINNFKSHFKCSSANANRFGVQNSSSHPLFESIAASGNVQDVTVRGNLSYSGSGTFSPLCGENNGKMTRCINQCVVSSATANLAGVCVTNNGVIATGCHNEATLTATDHHVAGVVYNNTSNGRVKYANNIATAKLSASQVGGVVYNNEGTVENCYASFNNTSSTGSIGCVVYSNSGSINNSYATGILSSTGGVAGICYTNSGRITSCRNSMDYLSGSNVVGGIAAIQNGATAEIRNSYADADGDIELFPSVSKSTGNVGGLIGHMQGGILANCYNTMSVSAPSTGTIYAGGAIGMVDAAIVSVQNCYASSARKFYGSNNSGSKISFCYGSQTQAGISQIVSGTLLGLLNNWVHDNGEGGKYHLWVNSGHPILSNQ